MAARTTAASTPPACAPSPRVGAPHFEPPAAGRRSPLYAALAAAALIACGHAALAAAAAQPEQHPAAAAPAPESRSLGSAAQAPEPVSATIAGQRMDWRAAPGAYVNGWITHTEGTWVDSRGSIVGLHSDVYGQGDSLGRARLTIQRSILRPRDRVTLLAGPGGQLTFDVPVLAADLVGDRLWALAPPGASVVWTRDADGADPAHSVDLATDDGGNVIWPPPGGDPLAAAGRRGWLAYVDADGHRFQARAARFEARIRMGARTVMIVDSPTTDVRITHPVTQSDGRVVAIALTNDRARDGDPLELKRLTTREAADVWRPGIGYTIERQSRVRGALPDVTGTLPELSVHIVDASRAAGSAPPGAIVRVEAYPPDAPDVPGAAEAVVTATAGADGAFQAAFDGAQLVAGWRVAALVALPDGAWAEAGARLVRFDVAVEGGRITALAQPGVRVTGRIEAPDGRTVASVTEPADDTGRATLRYELEGVDETPLDLPPGVLAPLAAGHIAWITWDDQPDPIRLDIPALALSTDPDAELVAGMAPPFADLEVEVLAPDGEQTFDIQADASGRWTLPLAGLVDLEPGVTVRASWVSLAGHRFTIDGGPVRIDARPDAYYVQAGPWIGRGMRVEVRTPDGRLVGRGERPADSGPDEADRPLAGRFHQTVELVDAFGGEPTIAPGDVLSVTVGADRATLVVPPLTGALHAGEDRVVGWTEPRMRVEVIAGEPDTLQAVTVTATADARGVYVADLSGRYDIPPGGDLHVRALMGPHTVWRLLRAPGLTLWYELAEVTGYLEPEVAATLSLERAGQPLAVVAVTTDGDGHLSASLRDASGAPLVPEAGDRIVVRAPEARLNHSVALDVPPFDVAVASDDLALEGRAPVGALPQVWVQQVQGAPILAPYMDGPQAEAVPGGWRADLDRRLAPGFRFLVSIALPEGHLLYRELYTPRLTIQPGGGAVCGQAGRFAPVDLTLTAPDGTARAHMALTASDAGKFTGRWADRAGQPVRAAVGDIVRALVAGAVMTTTVEPLTTTLDVPRERLNLITRPKPATPINGVYYRPVLTSPSTSCSYGLSTDTAARLAALGMDRGLDLAFLSTTDGVSHTFTLPAGARAGLGLDAWYVTTEGHLVWRPVYAAPTLAAWVGTPRLDVVVTPGAALDAALYDGAGALVATAPGLADDAGNAALQFASPSGAPVAMAGGHRVVLTASGAGMPSATVELDVAVLGLDVSARAVIVAAEPGTSVEIRLTPREGRVDTLLLAAGPDGQIRIRAEDVPPRKGWGLADLVAVRARVVVEGGHATVVAWRAEVDMGERPGRVFVPWTGRP